MKKLILLVCILNATFSNAQKPKIDTLLIDYLSGEAKLPKKLRVGDVLQISIKNLPLEFNKISAKTTFENDKMEDASIFSGFITKGMEKTETASTNSTSTKTNEDSIKNVVENLKKQYMESINQLNKKIIDSLIEKRTELDSLNKIKSLNKKELNKNLKEINKNFKEINNTNLYLKKIKKPKINVDNLEEVLNIGDAKNYLFNKIKSDSSNLLIKAIQDIEYQEYLIKVAKDNFAKINDSYEEAILKNAIKEDSLESLIPKFQNKNLIGVQISNRDYTNIDIEIKDKDHNTVNTISYSFNNHRGFKLDFSTGIFNTFRKNIGYEKTNYTKTDNNVTNMVDSVFVIKEIDKGQNNLSIGILAHGYMRNTDFVSFGLSFGFAYSIDSKLLNYLVGGSILLGKEQRFILNGGVAFAKIDELKLYETNKQYNKTYLNSNTDLKLASTIKGNVFVGISYNLGTIRTSSITKILN